MWCENGGRAFTVWLNLWPHEAVTAAGMLISKAYGRRLSGNICLAY